jgi:hypothetical protein
MPCSPSLPPLPVDVGPPTVLQLPLPTIQSPPPLRGISTVWPVPIDVDLAADPQVATAPEVFHPIGYPERARADQWGDAPPDPHRHLAFADKVSSLVDQRRCDLSSSVREENRVHRRPAPTRVFPAQSSHSTVTHGHLATAVITSDDDPVMTMPVLVGRAVPIRSGPRTRAGSVDEALRDAPF